MSAPDARAQAFMRDLGLEMAATAVRLVGRVPPDKLATALASGMVGALTVGIDLATRDPEAAAWIMSGLADETRDREVFESVARSARSAMAGDID